MPFTIDHSACCVYRKFPGLGFRKPGIQFLLFTYQPCHIFSKLLYISRPQLIHLQNGTVVTLPVAEGFSRGPQNEMTQVKKLLPPMVWYTYLSWSPVLFQLSDWQPLFHLILKQAWAEAQNSWVTDPSSPSSVIPDSGSASASSPIPQDSPLTNGPEFYCPTRVGVCKDRRPRVSWCAVLALQILHQ